MHELSAPEIIASILITWAIGLLPPLLIRYVIKKGPIAKWPAVGICAFFWFFDVFLFSALGSKSKSHTALLLVAFVSYWILRRGEPAARTISANDIGKNGFTELMHSAASGDIDRVTQLLAVGDAINQQDDQGKTPLMYAAMNDRQEVIRLLLQGGADPDITTKIGRSAAWFAERQGFDAILRLLDEHKTAHQATHETEGPREKPTVQRNRGYGARHS